MVTSPRCSGVQYIMMQILIPENRLEKNLIMMRIENKGSLAQTVHTRKHIIIMESLCTLLVHISLVWYGEAKD